MRKEMQMTKLNKDILMAEDNMNKHFGNEPSTFEKLLTITCNNFKNHIYNINVKQKSDLANTLMKTNTYTFQKMGQSHQIQKFQVTESLKIPRPPLNILSWKISRKTSPKKYPVLTKLKTQKYEQIIRSFWRLSLKRYKKKNVVSLLIYAT